MPSVTPVNNFLVPATGTTNSVPVVGNFSATPARQDFREVELNGMQFVPSGVFIDNSAGAAPLVIAIEGMSGFTVSCPAGSRMGRQYPAPIDQIVNITGNGNAVVIFVDFPVIPYDDFASSGGNAVTIADGADVAQGAQADVPAANDTGAFSLIALFKRLLGQITLNGYPKSATPLSASTIGGAAVLTATLVNDPAQMTYCTGFEITGAGATAASVINVTLTGALSTRNYKIAVPAGVAIGINPLIVEFDPPIPASAIGTSIVLNVPSFGAGNTDVALSIRGYRV